MTESYLFVSNIPNGIEFHEATESTGPFARIEVMAMELDKTSTNDREYLFEERESIRRSIVGRPIFYGLKVTRIPVQGGVIRKQDHDFSEKIGFAEAARIVGNKIFATIKVTSPKVVNMLKHGFKDFLFSVGGVADRVDLVKKGVKKVMQMIGAKVTHISMWKNKHEVNESGFEDARMTKLLGFSEATSILYTEYMVCENGICKILDGIRTEFEEAQAIMQIEDAKIEESINRAIAEDINRVTEAIGKMPWLFVDE